MVYASIDWYTAMLRNVSMREVLEKLEVFSEVYDDLMDEAVHKIRGFYSDYVFRSNGIEIKVSWSDYMQVSQKIDKIFDFKFSKMRLDLSGSGLRYIRGVHGDTTKLDKMLTDYNFWSGNLITITRCDFAYDFVNVYPDFIDNFGRELNNLMFDQNAPRTDAGLPCNLGVQGGKPGQSFAYQVKFGNSIKCLYFGTTRSDRLIRMYDKKLQLCDKNGAWKKQLDGMLPEFPKDQNIDSWFRIEIQCRNRWAFEYLFNMQGDMLCIIRHLFDTCKFKDPRNNEVFDSVKELFNWSDLPTYLCILHFTELSKPVLQRAEIQLDKCMNAILLLFSYYGMDFILSKIEDRIHNINMPTQPRHACQAEVFAKDLAQLKKEHPKKKNYHVRLDDGNNYYIADYRRA